MSEDVGQVVAPFPADLWDEAAFREVAIWEAYEQAPETAARCGGILAGPPELIVPRYGGDVLLKWPMVRATP